MKTNDKITMLDLLGGDPFFFLPEKFLSEIDKLTPTALKIYVNLYSYFSRTKNLYHSFYIKKTALQFNKSEKIIRSAIRLLQKEKLFRIDEQSANCFLIVLNGVNEEIFNKIKTEVILEEKLSLSESSKKDIIKNLLASKISQEKNEFQETNKELTEGKTILEGDRQKSCSIPNISQERKSLDCTKSLETNNNNNLSMLRNVHIDTYNRSLYIDTLTNYTNQETIEKKSEKKKDSLERVEFLKNNLEESKEEKKISYIKPNIEEKKLNEKEKEEEETKDYIYQVLLTWGFRNKVPYPTKAIREFINQKDLKRLYQVVESIKNDESISNDLKARYLEGRYNSPSFKVVEELFPSKSNVPAETEKKIPSDLEKLLEVWTIAGGFNNSENAKIILKQKVISSFKRLNDNDYSFDWNSIKNKFSDSLKVDSSTIKEVLGSERFNILVNKLEEREAVAV